MADTMLASEAITNAIRILQFAEQDTTNLQLMEAFTRLAESWTQVAVLLRDIE